MIRNKWQRTPLQRIEDTLIELKCHVNKLETEKTSSKEEINELRNTIVTLKNERENRM